MKNSQILLLGMAYKKDIGDMRESPALDVLELLKEKGAKVSYHDPYVPDLTLGGETFKSLSLTSSNLKKMDIVVVTTNHSVFDAKMIVESSAIVMDTRNATSGIKSSKIYKL